MFLNKNKEILIKQYPGFWEDITSDSEDEDDITAEDIKIDRAPTGEPTLCIKGLHVHSPRDPKREGQRLAETAAGAQIIVVFGFGLGFAAEAAAVHGKPIVIVEKRKKLFLKALEQRDFSDFLSKNKLLFIVGGKTDGILNALVIANDLTGADKKTSPFIIRNKTLMGFDDQWYKSVEDKVRTWAMKDDVNTATHKRFGQRWVRNLSKNMTAIRDYPGISRLEGLANGNPVFLAAAGPSLDKIKPLLRDIYDRCIIVAVDTSLRFFVKNRIQPDFVLVVDPQFWNSRHLDRCFSGKAAVQTALIAESAVYPPVLSLPVKNKFLCGSLFPLGKFIEDQVDPKGRLGAGGSVATTAWDFARSLGCNEIWIAGLDLAFPGLKTHFRGARFEELSNSQSHRLYPVEKWVLRALRDGFPFKARSGSGDQVLTDRRLSLYAAWFENQFKLYPQVQNYSLFKDGLDITGLNVMETEKLLNLPPRRAEIDSSIQAVFSKIENEFNNPLEKENREKRYEKAVSALKQGLKDIGEAAQRGAEIARRALRYQMNPAQQNKTLKELDEIKRLVTESEVKEIAGFLIPPAAAEEDAALAGTNPFLNYIKSTHKLFSSLAEAADSAIISVWGCPRRNRDHRVHEDF